MAHNVYIRAAARGVRSVLQRRRLRSSGGHSLDEALRHAAAFQQKAVHRWETAMNVNIGSHRRAIHSAETSADIGTALTLQHLAGVDKAALQEEEAEREHMSLSFAERRQAKIHAALQQWVFYEGFYCTRAEFLSRQENVANVLLLSPLRVIPSSHCNSAGAECLEASLRHRSARAYVDLLVHHKLTITREKEWTELCERCTPAGTEEPLRKQRRPVNGIAALEVMTLPFLQSSSPDASWERSLAVLSWAMQFRNQHFQTVNNNNNTNNTITKKKQQQRHISSVDIAEVLQQYAQHFGERMRVPGLIHSDVDSKTPLILNNAAEDSVVTRLQQWWVAAREAEQRDSKLSELCGLDRTVQNRIQVEGRKVTLLSSNESSSAGAADTAFAELLLQGRWEDVLRQIECVAADALRHGDTAAERQKEEVMSIGEEEEDTNDEHAAAAMQEDDVACVPTEVKEECGYTIGGAAPLTTVSTANAVAMFFNRPRPIVVKRKLWVHSTAARLGRVPHALLTAKETPAEAELLRQPPTAGLHTRRGVSTAALVELRRKMWIHLQLPRHVAHSIVRFEGTGTSMLPYVWRCPAKELLPWLLLSSIAAAAAAQQQDVKGIQETLHRVRVQTLYTLFSPVPYYAAFQEYNAELLIQLGNLLVSPTVMRIAVRSLLRPPSFRHFYDVRKRRRIPVEVECRELLWGSLENAIDAEGESVTNSSLSTSVIRLLGDLHNDPNALKKFAMCKAGSLRNYHVSTWIESCSKVETLEGLLDLFVQETNMYGPPLLSPEAAAALLTAVLLPFLQNTAADREKQSSAATETLRALGVVYFVVPADRAFGAAPYFKGIYNEHYITATSMDWAAEWSGAEALLVGRSIRRTTKYPTTTTETFFRVLQRQQKDRRGSQCPLVTFRVPELRLRLMTVDLLEAVRYFEQQKQNQQEESKEMQLQNNHIGLNAKPDIVARHLPFGVVAVNKPAGMSTTLHVAYPQLIHFLTRCVPWKGTDMPVLYQHGLVNRIDVGTSGLVLVTDTEQSLIAARRASVVDRCVEKTYRALLLHCPPPTSRTEREEFWYLNPTGVITRNVFANGADYSLQLAAQDTQRKRGLPPAFMDRRPATTIYRVLRYYPTTGVYDVEVQLRSGRRHQIRQHFAQLWHPLVGDGRYHARAKALGEKMGLYRPALHACRITLLPSLLPDDAQHGSIDGEEDVNKANAEKTIVECPLPEDMQNALRWLQEQEEKRKGIQPN